MYNSIHINVLEVEKPLIKSKISEIDEQIERGISQLNWKSENVNEYITQISTTVGSLSSILQEMKNNMNQINKILKQWSAAPLIERKDGKKLLNLEEKDAKLSANSESMKRDGHTLHALVEKTRQLIGADETSESWLNYKSFIDSMVVKGFWNSIKNSMDYLLVNMDSERPSDVGPLLEAKFELDNENLVFTPSMDEDSGTGEGFLSIMEDLIEDIYETSSRMARIAPSTKEITKPIAEANEAASMRSYADVETYVNEMRQDEALDALRQGIMSRVSSILECSAQHKETYEQYSYLWTENRQAFMKQFLQKPESESEEQAEEPILEKFESEIRKFEAIHKVIMNLEAEVVFNGWLKIDGRPLKQSLNVVVKKWSYTLTKHLSDDTVNILNELNIFVKENKKGLVGKIEEAGYDGLIKAMGLLHAIKHRSSAIDKRFEPLRKTVNLLRQFGVELPEEVHKLLNDLPEEWADVKKLSVSIKDSVAPLQAKEVDVLQQKCNKFEMKNHNFREEFRKKAPFKFEIGPDKAYVTIDMVHMDVLEMETEASALRKSCELFELNVPTYRQLLDCRRDIGMLKTLWDLLGLVTFMFNQWKTTLWTEIDTDSMETRCRDLSKDLRKLDKEIKGWDAYSGLDQMVKDMITSLRAVGELRSNAIRDRHWKQLMKTTGVTFVLTKDMKFQDLLSLQLHKYEDDVKGIVDRATKELAMEKVLNDLDKTWAVMELTYEIHASTNTPLLRSSEELIETLEDNQVMLQTMMVNLIYDRLPSTSRTSKSRLLNGKSLFQLWTP
jgi:dynein heavy chain, axonemal